MQGCHRLEMGADTRRNGCRQISEPLTVCVVITTRVDELAYRGVLGHVALILRLAGALALVVDIGRAGLLPERDLAELVGHRDRCVNALCRL